MLIAGFPACAFRLHKLHKVLDLLSFDHGPAGFRELVVGHAEAVCQTVGLGIRVHAGLLI